MNQPYVTEKLVEWLCNALADRGLEVLCDHVTDKRQEPGLYIGEKQPSRGRGNRIAQPDILIVDPRDKTIRLIVEVEPSSNPKKLLGDILAVLLADNYTPSNKYHADHYKFEQCAVIFLTELVEKPGSQKRRQIELIEKTISEKLDLVKFGVREVRLCFGANDEDSVARCQQLIRQYVTIRSGVEDAPACETILAIPSLTARLSMDTSKDGETQDFNSSIDRPTPAQPEGNEPTLPGDRGSYILWLSDSRLIETPRFVHFSWGPNLGAFKVRDYMSGKLYQQRGARPQAEQGFTIHSCELKCDEVWAVASKRIPASRDNNLYVNTREFEWWKNTLTEMTEQKR